MCPYNTGKINLRHNDRWNGLRDWTMLKQLLSSGPTGSFSLDRCKALVDGVFAIVVTLLVLGIEVPTDHRFSEQGLIVFLQRIGFDLLIYAVSFWLAATYWVQHAAIMHFFRNGSRKLVWLNLFFCSLSHFYRSSRSSKAPIVTNHWLRCYLAAYKLSLGLLWSQSGDMRFCIPACSPTKSKKIPGDR